MQKIIRSHWPWLLVSTAYATFVIFLLCIGLNQAVWSDDVASLSLGTWDWQRFWTIINIDYHPPGYFLLLRAWLYCLSPLTTIFTPISQAKLLSFIPNLILSLTGGWLLAKRRHYLSALIFALAALSAPYILPYAFEIRMYSLVMLTVTLAAYGAWRLLTGDQSIAAWLALIGGSVATFWCQYFAGVPVFFIWLLLLSWAVWQKNFPLCRRLLAAGTFTLVLISPSLSLCYQQSHRLTNHPLATASIPLPDDYWWHFPASLVYPLGATPSVTAAAFGFNLTNLTLLLIAAVSWWFFTPQPYSRLVLAIGLIWLLSYLTGIILYTLGVPFIPRYLFPVSGLIWFAWSLIFASDIRPISLSRRLTLAALALGTLILFAVNTTRFVRIKLAVARDTTAYTNWRQSALDADAQTVGIFDVGSLCILENFRFAHQFQNFNCTSFREANLTPQLQTALDADHAAYVINYRVPCDKLPQFFPGWQLTPVFHASPDNPQCQDSGITCPYNLVTPQCIYRISPNN